MLWLFKVRYLFIYLSGNVGFDVRWRWRRGGAGNESEEEEEEEGEDGKEYVVR